MRDKNESKVESLPAQAGQKSQSKCIINTKGGFAKQNHLLYLLSTLWTFDFFSYCTKKPLYYNTK